MSPHAGSVTGIVKYYFIAEYNDLQDVNNRAVGY